MPPRPRAGIECQISFLKRPQLQQSSLDLVLCPTHFCACYIELGTPCIENSCLPSMAPNMSLHSVLAVLILSTDTAADSSRLFAKYYTPPHSNLSQPTPPQPYSTLKEQKAFEKGLLEKTAKQTSDVILYDNKVVVFKMESDVMLYIAGSAEENEILLYNVVLALRDTLHILLKYVLPYCEADLSGD